MSKKNIDMSRRYFLISLGGILLYKKIHDYKLPMYISLPVNILKVGNFGVKTLLSVVKRML